MNSQPNTISSEELKKAQSIASLFDLPGPIEAFNFERKGNINQKTYLIKAGPRGNCTEYILQLLNPVIFTQPRAVMNAMVSCIQAQQRALDMGVLRGDEEWEPIGLVQTREGKPYLEVLDAGSLRCWRMMPRIRNASAYRSLGEIPDPHARFRIAEEAGRGLALFQILTADMDPLKLNCPLPGYRDTFLYYDQFASVLEGNRTLAEAASHLPMDAVARRSTELQFLIHLKPEEYRCRREDSQLARFIALALEQKSFALTLVQGLKNGDLKTVVIHGDTKLDNFLFNASTGNVMALVDLDTIMPHTWLSDWGDMVRSLVNVAGERERDLERIEIDLEVFKAVARGFLKSARHFALQEVGLMVEAAQIMALELAVRFLADYLRGDIYFKLGPADARDLNKIRALAQFCVFEKLKKNAGSLKRYLEELYRAS